MSEFENLKMKNHVEWIYSPIFFYWIVIANFFCISKSEAILLSGTQSKSFCKIIYGLKHEIATPAATSGFAMTIHDTQRPPRSDAEGRSFFKSTVTDAAAATYFN